MILVSGNMRFEGFRGEGCQTIVGLSKTAILSTFAHCFFGCFRVKANIITQYYLLHRCLSTYQKKNMTLNDLEWPFYVKICFFFKFNICLFTYMESAMTSTVKAPIIYLVKVTCIRAVSLYKAIKYSKT